MFSTALRGLLSGAQRTVIVASALLLLLIVTAKLPALLVLSFTRNGTERTQPRQADHRLDPGVHPPGHSPQDTPASRSTAPAPVTGTSREENDRDRAEAPLAAS